MKSMGIKTTTIKAASPEPLCRKYITTKTASVSARIVNNALAAALSEGNKLMLNINTKTREAQVKTCGYKKRR